MPVAPLTMTLRRALGEGTVCSLRLTRSRSHAVSGTVLLLHPKEKHGSRPHTVSPASRRDSSGATRYDSGALHYCFQALACAGKQPAASGMGMSGMPLLENWLLTGDRVGLMETPQ